MLKLPSRRMQDFGLRLADQELVRSISLGFTTDLGGCEVQGLALCEREAPVLASVNHPTIAASYGKAHPAIAMGSDRDGTGEGRRAARPTAARRTDVCHAANNRGPGLGPRIGRWRRRERGKHVL